MRKMMTTAIAILFLLMSVTIMPVNVSAAGEYSSYFAGGTGTAEDPYQISDVDELQNMNLDLDADYILVNDIDASATSGWNNGAGFESIGPTYGNWFTGTFDGDGYKITAFYINRPSTDYVGLFGATDGSEIKNVCLENIVVSGNNFAGGLVGWNFHYSAISNCYATGSVSGYYYVGGLVGCNFHYSAISNCYVTGSVSGTNFIGGLVGRNFYHNTISNCYATGGVSGHNSVGGLVGSNHCSISNCYATGSVSGTNYVGGLVGRNYDSNTISNCYATGSVSGIVWVGGLVGCNQNSNAISNCYATGSVSGTSWVGGLVGYNYYANAVSNSFWDTQTSGQSSSDGGTGKTTAEMKQQTTFVGWDFTNIWRIKEGETYPYLWWQTPEQATQDLISIVKGLNLHDGVENSFVSKLDNAFKSITNDRPAAEYQLQAFINEVEAQRGKELTDAQADMLIEYAQWIIDRI